MDKNFLNEIGTSFDLDQTTKAYRLGDVNINWTDYTYDWYNELPEDEQMKDENLVNLIKGGGIYGAADGYSLKANIIFGWVLVALILCSGLIIKLIVRIKSRDDFEEDERTWDELKET